MCLFSLHQSTPLHKAAERGHKDIVMFLVKKRADVSIKDRDGVSNFWGYYLNTGPRNLRIKDPRTIRRDPRTRDPRTQSLECYFSLRCCNRNATTSNLYMCQFSKPKLTAVLFLGTQFALLYTQRHYKYQIVLSSSFFHHFFTL